VKRLTVRHVTTYSYAAPVTFGPHRLMFRPRDSHDMRLLSAELAIDPMPAQIRWLHDVFGNSIAVATFEGEASALRFESTIAIEHYGIEPPAYAVEDYARLYPFAYSADEIPDLGRTTERHVPDPEHLIDAWARDILAAARAPNGEVDTMALLHALNTAPKRDLAYQARDAVGVQSPVETLQLKSGSCRDFAWLMIEAARSLGFAARFVSGYLYDPATDPAVSEGAATAGAGTTHAWVQVYVPGAGWLEFDPTNAIAGGPSLIRVAVAREPSQAVPLSGSFTGAPGDVLGMTVEVMVTTG
jgi:transglutaminase-like putative cysteine protease